MMICALVLSIPASATKDKNYVPVSFVKKNSSDGAKKILTPELLQKLGKLALYGAAFVPCMYHDSAIPYVCGGLEGLGIESASTIAPIIIHSMNTLLSATGTAGIVNTLFNIKSKAQNTVAALLGGFAYLYFSGSPVSTVSEILVQESLNHTNHTVPMSTEEITNIIKKAQRL